MARLEVNVDHIATLRQARLIDEPDPVTAAALAELAGADGIIVHLREDRRHIQDRDVRILRQTVKTRLNLEMAATAEIIGIAKEIRPDVATLVPEKREELTTEGGLDVAGYQDHIHQAVQQLQQAGIRVSLFVDPQPEQLKAASVVGANYVELHTGTYAEARSEDEADRLFEELLAAAAHARQLGLAVKAGHGLNYRNIKRFRGRKEFDEYSIGHSIISRAVLVGLERAVREMIALIKS
ncbi:pyridoxine 5'-phosphate synthase [Desulfobacca acetoxidans]|uniref:Pyridoxine 5'-phosphate synthase n=1 Tax=Desulfobacca acetoxidans (strain ATCC 700848 / DSM 11109 / ASRB2) TaxID=880072 RepID=F2NFK3_DESAR|nr:pyridoxine 5'-phosphate synthase [Desulfobacca acetoxidans]AEB10122.1 Pyridoxine 5'-phosphate synthase [Desulfobacca acetoxidans DSM 11109]